MPTPQEQLQRAKSFLQEKKYGEAQKILRQMPDNPTAQKWLLKLDEIAPLSTKTTLSTPVSSVLVYLSIAILLVAVAAGAFFLGRASIDAKNEEADLLASYAPTLTQLAVIPPTETSVPTLDPNRPGTVNNPISIGSAVDFDGGSIRILSAQKPSSFSMYKIEGFSLSDDPVSPVSGTIFASVEIEFSCPTNAITCTVFPDFELILNDVSDRGLNSAR